MQHDPNPHDFECADCHAVTTPGCGAPFIQHPTLAELRDGTVPLGWWSYRRPFIKMRVCEVEDGEPAWPMIRFLSGMTPLDVE